jgi:transposase, IS5 family
VLTLLAGQQESLWDEALPVEVKELPDDLAVLDRLLGDPAILGPIMERFHREVIEDRRAVLTDGRPTIAMETYVRLMVLKQRYRWGYRSLVAEVSDSIHLRRFCRISLSERVPDESTIWKLTRRIGPETVNEITRVLIVRATTIRRRSGEAKAEVLKLTARTGELLEQSIADTRRLVVIARRRARGRGAKAKLKAATQLEELADRCEKVASQIKQRVAGEPIKDRLVSLSDPDARPIRKGKLGKPNEFGYVSQICEVTESTKRGARGLIVPVATVIGNPGEDTLLPDTVAELKRLGISPREVALDGGFNVGPTRQALEDLEPDRVFISGRQQPGSRRTQRRMQRYRTGAEGRISHLKRGYGLDRSRLKGDEGQRIWTGWAILAYNADTLAVRER